MPTEREWVRYWSSTGSAFGRHSINLRDTRHQSMSSCTLSVTSRRSYPLREKRHFLEVLEAYRHGRTPLSSAVSILRSWVMRFESEYLSEQTFFNPFPEELMALDDSGRGRA